MANFTYLWFDGKGRKFLLAAPTVLTVVAGVDSDFDLGIESRVDIGRWVDASNRQRRVII